MVLAALSQLQSYPSGSGRTHVYHGLLSKSFWLILLLSTSVLGSVRGAVTAGAAMTLIEASSLFAGRAVHREGTWYD